MAYNRQNYISSYDPYKHATIALEKLFGMGVLRPEHARPAPPDPFEVERRWIVAADGTTYREFVFGADE